MSFRLNPFDLAKLCIITYVQPSKIEMVLPDENFSHAKLGLEVDEYHGHLLKLMAEDFDWSLSENTNENLKNILTVGFAKVKN